MRKYLPLFVVLGLSLAGAAALQLRGTGSVAGDASGFQLMPFMTQFMGLFLLCFAMFKLFDLAGFRKGFQKYDLLAGVVPAYALVYPFLELGLALLYLSGRFPRAAFIGTILLMGFGLLGIVRSMRRGQQLQCACMGTFLNVPLSTVSLAENAGMTVMAAVMLLLA